MSRSRREFLLGTGAALAAASQGVSQSRPAPDSGLGFPIVDYHVHLNAMSLDDAVAAAQQRGQKYGIVEHAGTKENDYPTVPKY